jgi:hypothetical protein
MPWGALQTNTSTTTPLNTSTNTVTNTVTNTPTLTPTITITLTPTNTPTVISTYTPTITSVIIISNPFPNPSYGLPISFNIQAPNLSTVTMDVFTLAFRKISSKTTQVYGFQNFQWDLKDASENQAANGLYYVHIHVTGSPSTTKILKVLILK